MVAAVTIGFVLSGRLLRPIRHLTQASQALARNELHQQRKRMTADITHDLSTPLQIISGYMEMLEEGDVTISPQRIEIIKTEIGHLRRLVGDLSTLTQVETGGPDIQLLPVKPSRLLEQIYHTYLPIAERQNIEFELDLPPAIGNVLVDEGRMLQVLKNLVENALRYTPQGGKITLSAVAGERVQLRVSDSGSGIDAKDLPYVFERFYRPDPARGNPGKMGLGLAICKALVTAQGGLISAESEGKDKGATVVITLVGETDQPFKEITEIQER
ncbi:MAG: HAMP domain-containing histidine kinase [Anaerolineales bacterium]|nr:HAMP domain-containing histidine kinase [Anaerolineales bacterium]